MIRAYLIHMCRTMWLKGDPFYAENWNKPQEEVERYTERLTMEWDKFTETMDLLPSQGFNTLIFDLGNAVQFERHPEINMKGSMTKDEAKKLIDRCRSLGMDPVPKLNFSAGHDPWLKKYARMIGTEEYYQVCRDCIDETVELFGNPKLFHLGLDEEVPSSYGFSIVRSPHIWWRDAYRLFDRCAHHNVRPWVWSDDYWAHPEEFKKNMPKSVLQAPWYYEFFTGYAADGKPIQKEYRTYFELTELGYDITPTCSTWQDPYNTDFTFDLVKNKLDPEHTLGIMTAPWCDCSGAENHLCMQDAVRFGEAMKKYYPEEMGERK